MSWRGRRSALCVGVVLTCVGVASANAIANDNMYKTSNASWNCWDGTMSNGLFCQTDNATLTVFMQSSVSSGRQTTIKNMLGNSYSPTVLAVSYPATASYSGGAETDII